MKAVTPTLVRRMIVAPLIAVAEAVMIVVSPLLAIVAVIVSPLTGGWRALRLLAIVVGYAARHLACTSACFGLWLASSRTASPRFQRAHYAVLRWFVGGVHRSVTRWARVTVETTGSQAAQALSARRRPVVVLSRHAGEGDSLLVLHELLCRHRRRLRVVLHQALRMIR